MNASVQSAVERWLNDPAVDEPHKREIRDLLSHGDEAELTDRFYTELEFGTGGMRGIIGAGLNRMNVYTVGAAAQGLANFVAQKGEAAKRGGVAIAYDCRRKSDLFARTTAEVLAGNGIKAHLFESLRPTPELSYAVRHLGCSAGVVVTASHNPPAYNGFKAYDATGAGVVPPDDNDIIREVRGVGSFANVKKLPFDQAKASGLIQMIGREVDEAFLREVDASCVRPEVVRERGKSLKIVYTPLHGTGITLVPEALRRRGFEQILTVPEQSQPNGEFPTVKSPNPEEGPALDMGIKLAQREGADLVIATDPDADRVGIAVRAPGGEFVLLSGNQTAALLTWYICEQSRSAGRFPKNAAVISTIVSGDMMKTIARSYGAEVFEVLTGFKWIAAKLRDFEEQGAPGAPSKTYLFGAEESYGYMPCTYVRDKDAVTTAAFIADLAAVGAAEGQSLYNLLQELYQRHGYHQEYTKNVTLPGKEGADRIKAMMQTLRTQPPREVGGIAVASVGDCQSGEIRDVAGGQAVGRYDLPKADVIVLTLGDGTKVIARPSGTEPKIKFYILTREPGDDVGQAKRHATAKIERILADIDRWCAA